MNLREYEKLKKYNLLKVDADFKTPYHYKLRKMDDSNLNLINS